MFVPRYVVCRYTYTYLYIFICIHTYIYLPICTYTFISKSRYVVCRWHVSMMQTKRSLRFTILGRFKKREQFKWKGLGQGLRRDSNLSPIKRSCWSCLVTQYLDCSVTRFGKISPILNVFGHFEALFRILQNFKHACTSFVCIWAKFQYCDWSKLEK